MGEMLRVLGSGSPTLIAMVQTAHFWERNDLSLFGPLDWSRLGWVIFQSQVRSTFVIVCEVGSEYALEVSLVEDDDVIQTFAANRPDQPFHVRRLPR